MKAKAWALVSVSLFLIVLVCAEARQQAQEQDLPKVKGQTGLVRKDLLEPTRKQLLPPQRNIFTRQRIIPSGEGPGFFGTEGEPQRGGTPTQSGSKNENTEISINVKYIGYVNSEQRVIALIIFGAETYAVESGDLLEGGINIGEITPDDIEIIGPDSEPNRVKLEGEKP
jgi:Tfp pilus assembly protein PilP